MRVLREQAACLIVISLALLATGCWASTEATVSVTSLAASTLAVSPTTEPVDTLMPEATPERTLEAMNMLYQGSDGSGHPLDGTLMPIKTPRASPGSRRLGVVES
jgi:hypothetical protein